MVSAIYIEFYSNIFTGSFEKMIVSIFEKNTRVKWYSFVGTQI